MYASNLLYEMIWKTGSASLKQMVKHLIREVFTCSLNSITLGCPNSEQSNNLIYIFIILYSYYYYSKTSFQLLKWEMRHISIHNNNVTAVIKKNVVLMCGFGTSNFGNIFEAKYIAHHFKKTTELIAHLWMCYAAWCNIFICIFFNFLWLRNLRRRMYNEWK